VSVIPDLAGGGALAASMVCEAIGASRPQVILTGSRGRFTGEDHHRLVADLDVPVIEVAGTGDLRDAIEALRPAVVVNHWWPSAAFKPLCRVGDERLILNSTSPVPLPPGYDVYVTLSDFQAAYQAHIPTERVVRIPNGIDLAVADAAVPDPTLWRQGLSDRTVRIAMLSRLDPDKFIARLPDCLDGLDPGRVEVTVAGRGARRWECAGELTRRGMEGWVRFIGPIAQSHVARFLAGADIGLHLTETHQESHPFAIMQMMAAGLPIVAQPRGALPEMVDHGQTGFLDSDPAEIARALGWLAENPGARAEFGAEARRRIAPFTAQAFHTAWRDLIERTVAEVPQGRQTCQSCPDAPDP
ncbi:MAG: glycosyltransferase family 4 protein, partial [Pseudomonadota bacterium]